jgi:hypothetical protein
MELVRLIFSGFATTFVAAVALIGFLFLIRYCTLLFVRSWTKKRLAIYKAQGIDARVTPFALESFAGTVAMCVYGVILIVMAMGLVILGYKVQASGLNPDMKWVWALSCFGGCIGLICVVLMGHSAYTRWADSFLPTDKLPSELTVAHHEPKKCVR